MDKIIELLLGNPITTGIGTVIAIAIVGAITKKLTKDDLIEKFMDKTIVAFMGKIGYGLGVSITLGASKYAKKLWNKTFEPLFIVIIQDILGGLVKALHTFVDEICKGMRSDNE